MAKADWHVAQLNVGRIVAPTDSPQLADFMNALDRINALAEASAGFVWRLQGDSGLHQGLRVDVRRQAAFIGYDCVHRLLLAGGAYHVAGPAPT